MLLACWLPANAGWLAPQPSVRAVRLAVGDVPRSEAFFRDVLGFAVDDRRSDGATMRLGDERLVLVARELGRPGGTPPARADDQRFQHVAIVVSDMARAYAAVAASGATVVSAGPQRLPDSNRDAAGIRAVYFRDPDGHFLELIEYPPLKGEPRWHRKDRGLFMGVDHTALVVADTGRSVGFYRGSLGMTLAGDSLNAGPEQEALSGVPGARVRISSLRGAGGPGVELLEYLSPRDPTPRPPDDAGGDWAIELTSRGTAAAVARDPDGHVVEFSGPRADGGLSIAADTLRRHWQRYALEAAQLGAFMAVTLWATLLLEHPGSPVRARLGSGLLRRGLMGVVVGTTVVLIIRSPVGVATGAHFNPAVTLSMLSLGRIDAWDATFYVAAQFLGGWAGLALAALPFRAAARHEKVNFVATLPGPRGVGVALVAEFAISFVLLAALLTAQRDPGTKHAAAFVAGGLLLLYIAFEAPLSGMSLNPARTVASAVAARRLGSTWPYFVAPTAGMLLAARLFGH